MKKNNHNPKRNFLFLLVIALLLCCHAGLAQNRDDVNRLLARAATAYEMGNYEDALNEYKKVQKLAPNHPDLYKAIAEVYEKLGSVTDLVSAMESYEAYLRLAPKAKDREAILKKTASLEYIIETKIKQEKILDDFSGIWISNLHTEKTKTPLFMFSITEPGKEGKFRVELLPESGFFSKSIINSKVNVVPDNKNGIRFTFADAQAYIPSQAGYDLLRGIADITLSNTSSLAALGATTAVNAVQANDLPSNTQTAYNFDLKYNKGQLKGYCNIIKNVSNPKGMSNQDDLFELVLEKNNDYFKTLSLTVTSGGATKDDKGKYLLPDDVKKLMYVEHHDLWKKYKSGYNMQCGGGFLTGFFGGLAIMCGAGLFSEELDRVDRVNLTTYVIIPSAGLTAVGVTMISGGIKKSRKACEEYNQRIQNSSKSSSKKTSSLNFGITTSGNLGAVLTF